MKWRPVTAALLAPPALMLALGIAAPGLLRLPTIASWIFVAVLAVGFLTMVGLRLRRLRRSDYYPLVFALVCSLPLIPIAVANGSNGRVYTAAGWIARDSFFYFALSEMSVQSHGWPRENPFLAGERNQYPALLHMAGGTIARMADRPAAIVILALSPIWFACGFALLFLSIQSHAPRRPLVVGLAAALPILLRPDLFYYINPQSIALPIFLTMMWLIGPRPMLSARWRIAAAGIIGVALSFSHAITGLAAGVVLAAVFMAMIRRDRTRASIALAGLLCMATAWILVNGGGGPGLGSAVLNRTDFLRLLEFLTPWTIPILAAVAAAIWRFPRSGWRGIAVGGMLALSAAFIASYCLASTGAERGFLIWNIDRLPFFAVLIAAHLLPSLKAKRLAMGAIGCGLVSVIALPTWTLRGTGGLTNVEDAVRLGPEYLRAYDVLRAAPPGAVFSADPNYAAAAFTGKPQNGFEPFNLWGARTAKAASAAKHQADLFSVIRRVPPESLADFLRGNGYAYFLVTTPVDADAPMTDGSLLFHENSVWLYRLE